MGGYLLAAGIAVRRARAVRTVSHVAIEVVDSTSRGHLVSTMRVREWIVRSRIPTIGTAVDTVDLTGIEALIACNGFVEDVAAYVTYSGELCVEISQREPLLRLLTDGVNSYITTEGYVFVAPRASSLYVPVVTGSYRLPIPADYVGDMRTYIDGKIEEIQHRIVELEREKYPFYKRERENDRRIAELARRRVRRGWFESARRFEQRVAELRQEKALLRRSYRYEARMVQQEIDRLSAEQERERERQKKIGEKLRRFDETPYLCRNCRERPFLEVGGGADRSPFDPRRRLGDRPCAAQRPPYDPFRPSGAAGAQTRQVDAFLSGRTLAYRVGRIPYDRHKI